MKYKGPTFGAVPRSLWERSDISRGAKVLFAFCCSAPGAGGLSGIFRLSTDAAREILGYNQRKLTALLGELQAAGLLMFDGRWVWICNATAMTPGFSRENANHRRALDLALAEAPDRLAQAYRQRYALPDEHLDAHRHEHADPGTGTGTGTGTGIGEGREIKGSVPPSRLALIEALEREGHALAEQARTEAPECGLTFEEIMKRASRIPPSNGREEKAFKDPRATGLSDEWLTTTLRKLPEVRAQVSAELSPPRL